MSNYLIKETQMSDKELEMQEDDAILEAQEVVEDVATEEENLDEAKKSANEMKADNGTSEMAAPTATKATPPKTKIGMINAMAAAMKEMKKDDLMASYGKMMAAMHDDEEMEEMAHGDKEKKKLKAGYHESKKVTKEDIDVSADVNALFGSEELSEEFKESATTIFEAAVLSKVNEVLESATAEMASDLDAEKETMVEDLTTKLDDYLEYVAEEWMKDNELAIEKGVRAEIVENFMHGLRNLFAENYIDIPEEKVDLVDELAGKVEELEASVNEEVERNIEVKKELVEMKKDKELAVVCEGLTDSQVEKMKSLAEGVDYDADTYAEKLATIKENYFPSEEVVENDATDEEPLEIEEEATEVTGSMAAYTDAISRSIKK
jgi:hypothetical protein